MLVTNDHGWHHDSLWTAKGANWNGWLLLIMTRMRQSNIILWALIFWIENDDFGYGLFMHALPHNRKPSWLTQSYRRTPVDQIWSMFTIEYPNGDSNTCILVNVFLDHYCIKYYNLIGRRQVSKCDITSTRFRYDTYKLIV